MSVKLRKVALIFIFLCLSVVTTIGFLFFLDAKIILIFILGIFILYVLVTIGMLSRLEIVEQLLRSMRERVFIVKKGKVVWTGNPQCEYFGNQILNQTLRELFHGFELGFDMRSQVPIDYPSGRKYFLVNRLHLGFKRELIIVENITEKVLSSKKISTADAKIEAIHQLTKSGHYEWDKETDTNNWSEAFYKIYGVSKEKFSGYFTSVFISLIHPDDRRKFSDYLDDIKKRNLEGSVVYRIVRPNGEICSIREANQFVREAGEITKMIGVVQDISDIRKLDAELVTAKERAEDANRAKTNFLMNMGHELRTPLDVIMGSAEVLSHDLEKKNYSEMGSQVETLKRSGDLMLSNIQTILDLSKIELGKMSLDQSHFILSESLASTVSVYRNKLKRGVALDLEIDQSVKDVSFYGDESKILQIVSNLLGNAVKFTDKGFVKVSLSFDMPWVNFSVQDTGGGISKDRQQDIFGEFFKRDTERSNRRSGTGLGLHLTKEIVKLMGGEITFSSDERGTIFKVKIVLSTSDEISKILGDSKKSKGLERRTKNVIPKILVVDDADDNRILLRTILSNMNYQVDEADSAKKAIEAVKKNNYDLVLMDIQMPEIDGHEATRQIRFFEKENSVPANYIIACTAHCFKEDVERVFEAGCNDHLPKPIKKAHLKEILSRYGI